MEPRKRILFFAEAVTLAHVARPIALAEAACAAGYDAAIACDARYRRFLDGGPFRVLPLQTIPSERFLRALEAGRPLYDAATLRGYVENDLALIAAERPDLVVGDFRLSLSVSARRAGVPSATVTNAYWSPLYPVRHFPLPAITMTRFLPIALARTLFRTFSPVAMRGHCKPLNQVRAEHGLPSLGTDLRRVYTDADHVLYADLPDMFPIPALPANHRFLGPLLWSPRAEAPAWWNALPAGRPIVYVTLGSSGHPKVLRRLLSALGSLPVTVIASSAGAPLPERVGENVFVAPYLPGTEAAARASLVVCNGGSPTSQQAFAAGVPVLAVAGNMDQFLNMEAVERAQAGLLMRADRVGVESTRAMAATALASDLLRQGAGRLRDAFARHDAGAAFVRFATETVGPA